MGVEIRGMDRLKAKLKAMPKVVEDAVWDGTFEIVEEVATNAASRLQSSAKHSSGELAGSIKHEVVVDASGKVVGRVWSDKDTAIYSEFGTGPVGEASKKDLPPGITPVYSQERWFIPANKVMIDLEAVYGIPRVTIKDQDFFVTRGQPARPWLYPSLKEVEERAPSILADYVKEGLKKL